MSSAQASTVDQPGGRILAVRVSVDGGPWQVVSAKDGLYDSPTERFEASLASPGPGAHEVVAQATDSEQNVGAAAAAR